MSDGEETEGSLLGGRVRYAQYRQGFRSGIEPVLLAASVPARAGERVIEAGCGAGAGLLSLAGRKSALSGLGIERDPALAALARRNIAANGWTSRLEILAADITVPHPALAADRARFDHAFANPPWHAEASTPSPHPALRAAKIAAPSLLGAWISGLAALIRQRGTLTLILPAAQIGQALPAMAANGLGSARILPLWPKAGRPARLILVQSVKGGRGGETILPGLLLHEEEGRFTAAAEAVLRDGAPLPLLPHAAPPA